jgi:ABC-type transport system involved in multi-copper enzyme maturation permease subunit
MFALFFLGGLLPAVLRLILVKMAGGEVSDADARAAFEVGLTRIYNPTIGKHLATSPPTLYFLLEGTLTFLPLLVLLVGFDQIAGEIQHRTIRYSAGRASRSSIVAGKALGIWGVVSIMIAVLHLTVWIVALIQSTKDAGAIFSWGSRILLFSWICATAYVGFSSLVSSLFRTPIVALFVGAGVGFAIWLLNKVLGLFTATERITWLFPNRYERLLMEPDISRVAGGLVLFVVWGAACVALSSLIVARRDV